MKSGILLLVALSVCAAAVNENCVCSQCHTWTCTTNQCEGAERPSSGRCKTSRGGSLSAQGINEASYGGYVYSIQDDKTNRGDALAKCYNDGFTGLASIENDATFQTINSMLLQAGKKAGGDQYWLSFNAIGRPARDFIWPDTGSTYFGNPSWWVPGEPGGDGHCGALMAQAGQLNDLDCNGHQMPRICMAPDCAAVGGSTAKVCRVKGRGRVDANTYEEDDGEFIYQFQMTPKTGWAAAKQACQESGFVHLATLDTEAKRQFFVGMMNRSGHKGPSGTPFDPQLWTSFNDRNGTRWEWEPSGSTSWQQSWWEVGKPFGTGVCGSIGVFGTYNNAPCEFATGRICQKSCN